MSVILLSSSGNALLAPLLNSLEVNEIFCKAVIIDGLMSSKNLRIQASRLDPSLEIKQIVDLDSSKIPFYFINNHNSNKCIDLINSLAPNYLINAGTPRILNEQFLKKVPDVINCHPGILPFYRGCTVVEWSIYNNDDVGATAHFMNLSIDEGPIIMSEYLVVKPYESYEIIRTRMLFHQVELISKSVILCINKDIKASDLPEQELADGIYYEPIPISNLFEAKRKLLEGKYYSPQSKR